MRLSFSFILIFFFLLGPVFDTVLYGQNRLSRPKFRIPTGQVLYTDYSGNVWDLEPYEKKSEEQLGDQRIQVIERGNYRIKVSEEGIDTLGFWVEEWRFDGLDTHYHSAPIELRKTSPYTLWGDVHFGEKRVTFIPFAKQKGADYTSVKGSSDRINEDDQNLYFKKEPGEHFHIETTMGAFSLLTIPVKIRAGSSVDSLRSASEIGFNNLLLFVGVGNGWHQYEQGRMRNAVFNFGAFLGPTRVRLTARNTNNAIEEDIDRFGWSLGIAFLASVRRMQFGLSVGTDFLAGAPSYDWAYQGSAFYGFTLGYSINRQFFD